MPEEIVAQKSVAFEPVDLPKNVWVATVASVRDMSVKDKRTGQMRNIWIIDFRVEPSGKIVSGICNTVLTERTKLWKWLTAMGIKLHEGTIIRKTDLIGRKCRVVSDIKTLIDGRQTSYVSDCLPLGVI